MLQAAGDEEGYKKAALRLRTKREQYRIYSNTHNFSLHNDRTQVYGFDRSESMKAVWAEKKAANNLNLKNSTGKDLTNVSKSVNINTQEKTKSGSLLFSEKDRTRLLQHERIISGNKYETAIIYNSDGSIAFKKKGTSDKVVFTTKEIKSMQGKTLTHNHPNSSIPSPNDINIMRRGGLSEIRACNSKGAYVIRCPNKWSRKLTSLDKIEMSYNNCINEAILKYKDIAARNGENFLKYYSKAEIEGLETFCKKYDLIFDWEDKI